MLNKTFTAVSLVVASSAAVAVGAAQRKDPGPSPCRPNATRSASGSAQQPRGSNSANPSEAVRPHAYFEMLTGRSDCLVAYSLRHESELDALDTVNKNSAKKRPMVYDSVHDAAKLTIHAPTSTDIKGKLLPLGVASGTMLLTWEFRFDENFRWVKKGNMIRHKTWRLLPGPWLAVRTDYKHAAGQGKFAELLVTLPGKRFLGPGTRRGAPGWFGEMLQPQRDTFYFNPDTWVRVWIFVEDLDKPACYLSVWAADEKRDAVKLYDRIALIPAKEGLKHFQIEYDTSADSATNANEANSWNRNVVVLHNVSRADVGGLLKRP